MNKKNVNKTVLITGCSTGIGFATACLLAEKGFTVLAGVRKNEDKKKLTARGGPNVTPIILDVTKEQDIDAAGELIIKEYGGTLDALINNAGVLYPSPLKLAPMELIRKEMEVNYFGVVALTQKLLPAIKNAKGRIVNMSSMNGRVSMPAVGNYAASKFALEAYTDALRMEIAHAGVNVSLVEPGQIKTVIFNKALDAFKAVAEGVSEEDKNFYGKLMQGVEGAMASGMNSPTDPLTVAECVLNALTAEAPLLRYVVGDDAKGFLEMSQNSTDAELDQKILQAFGIA